MQWLKDKDGTAFGLNEETWAHIQEFHPEITSIELMESVLLKPDWIVRSGWNSQTHLYYQRIRSRRFRVVVVQVTDKRIKTTLTTDNIKQGEIIWPKRSLMP